MLKLEASIWDRLRHVHRPALFKVHGTPGADTDAPTVGQRLAERVAAGVGSWTFLSIQAGFLSIEAMGSVSWTESPCLPLSLVGKGAGGRLRLSSAPSTMPCKLPIPQAPARPTAPAASRAAGWNSSPKPGYRGSSGPPAHQTRSRCAPGAAACPPPRTSG